MQCILCLGYGLMGAVYFMSWLWTDGDSRFYIMVTN